MPRQPKNVQGVKGNIGPVGPKGAPAVVDLDAPLPELNESDLIEEVSPQDMLLSDYKQVIANQNIELNHLNEILDRKIKAEKDILQALEEVHNRAAYVIEEQAKHYDRKVNAIFNIINSIQTLLEKPELSEKE